MANSESDSCWHKLATTHSTRRIVILPSHAVRPRDTHDFQQLHEQRSLHSGLRCTANPGHASTLLAGYNFERVHGASMAPLRTSFKLLDVIASKAAPAQRGKR
eukprot:scaffold467_cov403-Prasinococcus_capsulatus_cf.AAC.15